VSLGYEHPIDVSMILWTRYGRIPSKSNTLFYELNPDLEEYGSTIYNYANKSDC